MSDDNPEMEIHASGNNLWISYESSVEHEFRFTIFDYDPMPESDRTDTVVWPEAMIQQGEHYRIGAEDVPEFVEDKLNELGYKLEDG